MSRHAQLPPRCPLQKKTVAPQPNIPLPSCRDIKLHSRECGHYRSMSESSILEEQPPWLDDLLSDSDSNSSVTLESLNDRADSCEPDDGLVSTGAYGPNSPRRKNKLVFPEKEIVSALSEHVMQNPLQQLDGYMSVSGVLQSNSFGDACASVGERTAENKPMKCHPGQRSRARKLEYIAELESTVGILQNMGSQLAGNVASLVQKYTVLSMENKALKQHLLRMKQEKFIVDGEYQSLKNEVERLRADLALSSNNNKFHKRSSSAASSAHSNAAIWSMLDMRKLDLN